MKTKTLASLFAIVSMLVIVSMAWMPTASAEEREGTETIDEDYRWWWKVSFFSGDYLTLSYTITVQNNVYIDVMLLDEENLNKYKSGESFSYYRDGTDFNTIYTDIPSITLTAHDNYYLVVDNTDAPPGGATPAWDGVNNYCTFHYYITFDAHNYPSDGGSSTTWEDDDEAFGPIGLLCAVIVIAVIFIIVAVVIGVLLHFKQKGQKPQPYQPSQQQPFPPLQPYHRDQQPPPPSDYRPPQ